MKCTPMKLLNRSEYFEWKPDDQKCYEPIYFSKESDGYSYSTMKNLSHDQKKSQIVSVKNLELPENFQTYNLGLSLEKWSKKRPRLKSGHKERNMGYHHFEEHDENECDITDILDNLEDNKETSKAETSDYELNSDIEELWQRSQGSYGDETTSQHKSSRTREKAASKLKKTIRFSFSKPASPQTEQVIRVDVSSNISLEELKLMNMDKETCGRSHSQCKKEAEQNFRRDDKTYETEEQDFVIRCSHLALSSKKLSLN
nr:uncharacterized protein LOC111517347 [Leptinotarsa decemlineata]XP_023029241.1 uncharacterized protein LOC111517347 [Leptinotarsa decemlineata]